MRAATIILLCIVHVSAFAAESDIHAAVRPRFDGAYRPGRWASLWITLENRGPTRSVIVRIRDALGKGGVDYRPAPASVRGPLRKGSTRAFEFQIALSGGSANPILEVLDPNAPENAAPIHRKPLGSLLKPLAARERLVAVLGPRGESHSYPRGKLSESLSVRRVDVIPATLPFRADGFAPLDLLVVGRISRDELSGRHRKALRKWLLGGGRVLVTEHAALVELEDVLLGAPVPGAPPMRTWQAMKQRHPDLDDSFVREWSQAKDAPGARMPSVLDIPVGFGRVVVIGMGYTPADAAAWRKRGEALFASLLTGPRHGRADARIDPRAHDLFVLPDGGGSFGDVLGRVRLWSIFFVLLMIALAALFYRRSMRARSLLALVAGSSLAYSIAAACFLPEPQARIYQFGSEVISADGRARVAESYLQVTPFRDGPAPSVGCRPAAPMVLGYFAQDLARHRHVSFPGPPSRIERLAVMRQEPPVLRARWLESVDGDIQERRFAALEAGGKKLSFRVSAGEPAAKSGYYLVRSGRVWPVDLNTGVAGKPLRIDALGSKVFPDGETSGASIRRRQALTYGLKKLPRTRWHLVWWAPHRTDTWTVADESIQALGALHAAEARETEK